MTDVGKAEVEVVGDVRQFARQTERDLDRALSKMDLDPVKIPIDKDQIRHDGEEAGEAAGTGGGRAAGKAFSRSLQKNTDENGIRRFLAGLFGRTGTDSITLFANALGGGLAKLPSLIKPALITAAIGIAAALAAVAGPAIGGLLAASIIAGAGLALAGLGAFLLREEPKLKSAASSLGKTFTETMRNAALPILDELVGALGIFEKTVVRIGPTVRSAFGVLAPAIEPFARGLAGLVESSLPGFLDLIAASNPLLREIAGVLPSLGQSISNFFGDIAASGPEATIFFKDFIRFTGFMIRQLGELIGWLARSYVALRNFITGFSSFGEFADFAITKLKELVTQGFQFLVNNLPQILQSILSFRQQVTDGILQMVGSLTDALPTLIPQVVAGVIGLVTALVNSLATNLPRIVTAAGDLVNALVDGIVKALPTLIPAAVQLVTTLLTSVLGLIPILIQAGLRLVQGLISGIISAIPAVSLALVTAIPQILNAVITALPQLLLAGVQLVLAIVQGIASALPQFVSVMQTQVVPALLNTLRTQGPALISAGVNALIQFMQGMVSAIGQIVTLISTVIIPAITQMFNQNPELIQAGIDVLTTILNAMVQNMTLLTTFISSVLVPQITALLKENPGIIQAGLDIMLAILNGMVDNMPVILDFITGTLIPTMTSAIIANAPQIARAGITLMIALSQAFLRALPSLISAGVRAGLALLQAVMQIQGQLTAAGVRLMIGFASSIASAGASRVRSAISTVRSAVTSAFASAGNWLTNAGRQIINGLISGIQAGFGRVQGLLSSLTSMLPDWKGPAEVDKKILWDSGRMVTQGFERGIRYDQFRNVRKTLEDLTGNLPTWSSGPARGGDGASSGSVTLTIQAGAIVIKASDRAGGEEAAEALLERLAQATTVR